jgi:hypothetical protein
MQENKKVTDKQIAHLKLRGNAKIMLLDVLNGKTVNTVLNRGHRYDRYTQQVTDALKKMNLPYVIGNNAERGGEIGTTVKLSNQLNLF